MDYRREELAWLGDDVKWLSGNDAQSTFELALKSTSKTRYGLNEELFHDIQRIDIEHTEVNPRQWLVDRIGCTNDRILLIFGKHSVCTIPVSIFVDRWQDVFCPSRDDVIVMPIKGTWCLFYCHEDEFEFAP